MRSILSDPLAGTIQNLHNEAIYQIYGQFALQDDGYGGASEAGA
jgi:hypothetical protein